MSYNNSIYGKDIHHHRLQDMMKNCLEQFNDIYNRKINGSIDIDDRELAKQYYKDGNYIEFRKLCMKMDNSDSIYLMSQYYLYIEDCDELCEAVAKIGSDRKYLSSIIMHLLIVRQYEIFRIIPDLKDDQIFEQAFMLLYTRQYTAFYKIVNGTTDTNLQFLFALYYIWIECDYEKALTLCENNEELHFLISDITPCEQLYRNKILHENKCDGFISFLRQRKRRK
jgi:hypothetical protein